MYKRIVTTVAKVMSRGGSFMLTIAVQLQNASWYCSSSIFYFTFQVSPYSLQVRRLSFLLYGPSAWNTFPY